MQEKFTITSSHPALAGHFPGNPVVPGVVLLDCIKQIALKDNAIESITGVNNLKFMRPVLPEQQVDVSIENIADKRLRFICQVESDIVMQGEFETGV